MAKKFFNAITIVLFAVLVSFSFSSCQKEDLFTEFETYAKEQPQEEDNTETDDTDNGNEAGEDGDNTDDGTDNGDVEGNDEGNDDDGTNDDTGNGDDNGDNDGDTNPGTDDETGNGNDEGNDDNGDDGDTGNGDDNGTIDDGDERETPSWLGQPVDAVYTRVIKTTNAGERFEDMIIFRYQNGCVLAPKGQVDMSLMFAYNQSTASAQGVKYSPSGVNTAVWASGNWYAAKYTVSGSNWSYDGTNGSAIYTLTIHQNDATAHGIGVDRSVQPKAQSSSVYNGVITIKYAQNNGSTTASSSLSLK